MEEKQKKQEEAMKLGVGSWKRNQRSWRRKWAVDMAIFHCIQVQNSQRIFFKYFSLSRKQNKAKNIGLKFKF